MKTVQTVLGTVPTEQLGLTLMHEHIVSSAPGIAENYPQMYIKDAFDVAMKDLGVMKAHGVRTVLDATPYDLGRDVKMLKALSEKSGLNIICCTGFFLEPSPFLGCYSKNELAALFIDDVRKGIAGTGIKAGIIKTAMDKEGPTPGRVLVHRAVAVTANETGLPIMLHSYPQGEMGRHQIRIMQEEGVDLERVKIDHCLETTDMDYLSWLYDQGCWLGVDRLPLHIQEGCYAVSTIARIRTIKRMLDAGMGDRMLLSHDFMSLSTCYDHLRSDEEREYYRKLNPERFAFLQDVAFKQLVEWGEDEQRLTDLCIDNPRRFFEGG